MSGSNKSGFKRPTVSIPRSMDEEIEEQLEYGDSKSGYIREAIRERLDRENDVTTEE